MTTALDVLFEWAAQQPSDEPPTINVFDLSSVAFFPSESGYGLGSLAYSPHQWVNMNPGRFPPFWIDVPASFSGNVSLPKVEIREEGRLLGFGTVEVLMTIQASPVNLIGPPTYSVIFYDPPTNFSATANAAAVPSGAIGLGDVQGTIVCTTTGDAFSIQFGQAMD
jgi:hypothetical protein